MREMGRLGRAQAKLTYDLRKEPPLRDLLSGKTLGLMMARDGVSHAELTRLIETVRTNVVAKQA